MTHTTTSVPLLDLRDVAIGEIQFSRANVLFHLSRIARANDRGSHRRIV